MLNDNFNKVLRAIFLQIMTNFSAVKYLLLSQLLHGPYVIW